MSEGYRAIEAAALNRCSRFVRGVLGVVLCGPCALSCAAPKKLPGPSAMSSTGAVSSSSGAASSPSGSAATRVDAGAAADAGASEAPPALEMSFEMEAGVGSSTLMMLATGRKKQALRVVEEPFTCAGVEQTPKEMRIANRQNFVGNIACKPSEPTISVVHLDGALVVSELTRRGKELLRIPLSPRQGVRVDMNVRSNASAEVCPADAPPVLIEVKLLRRLLPEEMDAESASAPDGGDGDSADRGDKKAKAVPKRIRRVAWFEVPKFGVALVAAEVHRPEACDSVRVRKRLTFSCVSQEAGGAFTALLEHGVMTLSHESTNYGEDYRSVVGAVKLPCGAKVKWPKFRLRDPEWSGVGIGPCGAACFERQNDCNDRCRLKRPEEFHDDGEPRTDAAADCIAECELASKHCGCPQFG